MYVYRSFIFISFFFFFFFFISIQLVSLIKYDIVCNRDLRIFFTKLYSGISDEPSVSSSSTIIKTL